MREVVSAHLGQAGCGIGATFWDQLCQECSASPGVEAINKEVFFHQEKDGTFLPRALFADPDPESLRRVASSRKWKSQTFHSGREDAASNYVRGRYNVNMTVAGSLGEGLRNTLEQCDSPQGLLLTYSLAGGGGSSLAAMLSEGACSLGGDIKDLLPSSLLPASQAVSLSHITLCGRSASLRRTPTWPSTVTTSPSMALPWVGQSLTRFSQT